MTQSKSLLPCGPLPSPGLLRVARRKAGLVAAVPDGELANRSNGVVIDVRDLRRPEKMTAVGFVYHGIGRGSAAPAAETSPNLRVIA